MKNKKALLALLITIGASQAFAVPGGSAQHASKAVKHSGKAMSHTVMSAGKAVSGVVAVPLLIVGNAGPISAAAGEALWDNATDSKPLSITEKTITADPAPQFALQQNKNTQNYCEGVTTSIKQKEDYKAELLAKKAGNASKPKKTSKQSECKEGG
jgi:hypothetical protein